MDKGFMIKLKKVELWFVFYIFFVSMVLMVGIQLITFHVWKVFYTSDWKGWGIMTLQNLKARALIFESIGEIVNNEKLGKGLDKCLGDEKKVKNYAISLDGDWELERTMQNDEALCLDAMIFENIVWFWTIDVKMQTY